MNAKRARADQGTAATAGRVWLEDAPATPRAPALTRDRITAAVVDVLDAEGLGGLSMRTVARRLDVHATSLYWHVAGREDLLDLALDAAFGEIEHTGTPGAEPLARIAGYMDGLRAALLRHPWAAVLAGTRPLLGPNALAHAEAVHAALVAAGFSGLRLTAAAALVTDQVCAAVATQTAAELHGDEATRDALAARVQADAGRYPTLAAHPPLLQADWDAHFAQRRDLVLKGLAAG
ncbi:TetR/AcrR family transcriptional regulator [Marinactinospora rubrisoli]|uniref:TetR/AcrR family transcriptional regulator n=1 Tax=Marinactinospora rubrisoli TaxID=2715399 RepID=A0ABW2KLZ4_9ACTN